MKEIKKREPIPWQIGIALLAAALLNGGAMLISTFTENAKLILFLYYLCKLFSLFVETVGLGAAILYLAKQQTGNTVRIILLSSACNTVTLLIAAVRESFVYVDVDLEGALVAYIAAAITNALITLLVHTAALLFVWLLFFRRLSEPMRPRPRLFARTPLGYANTAAIFVLLAYQLFGLVPETVSFIMDYWPNIYQSEILSMIFDYIFMLVSLALGYLLIYLTQLMLTPEEA